MLRLTTADRLVPVFRSVAEAVAGLVAEAVAELDV
jgi:hypothetical protein